MLVSVNDQVCWKGCELIQILAMLFAQVRNPDSNRSSNTWSPDILPLYKVECQKCLGYTMFYAEYQPIHMLNEVGFKLACTMLLLTKDCSPLLLLSTSLQVLSE